MTKFGYRLFWLPIAMMALLAACVSVTEKKTLQEEQFSGYLNNYDEFTFYKEQNAFLFKNKEAKGKYDKIFIREFRIFGPSQSQDKELAKRSTEYMRKNVESILSKKGLLTDSPIGEGVAILRMAITGTEKTKEDIEAYNLIPVSFIFTTGQVATGTRATFIEAAMEAELTDTSTRERLLAVVQKGIGETEKRSGEKLTFEDLVPVMDAWLAQFDKTIDAFMAG
ncbi:DUF3313 domain-containing protein [Pseudomonadota bacterium]